MSIQDLFKKQPRYTPAPISRYNAGERTETFSICRESNNHLALLTKHGKRELFHRDPETDTWEPVQDLTNVSGRDLAENYGLKKQGLLGIGGPRPMKAFYQEQGTMLVSKEHNDSQGLWERSYATVTSGEMKPCDSPYPAGKAATSELFSGTSHAEIYEIFPPGYSGFLSLQWTTGVTTHEPDLLYGVRGGAYYGSEYVVS